MRIYQAVRENLPVFRDFFRTWLPPVQFRHGARLAGRWETEDGRTGGRSGSGSPTIGRLRPPMRPLMSSTIDLVPGPGEKSRARPDPIEGALGRQGDVSE
jgi:hypothetical protein